MIEETKQKVENLDQKEEEELTPEAAEQAQGGIWFESPARPGGGGLQSAEGGHAT
jgi:hypothetical protein